MIGTTGHGTGWLGQHGTNGIGQPEMTAGKEQPGQEKENKTARKGQSEDDSKDDWDRKTVVEQPNSCTAQPV
jgi:hypothetical protein